MRSVVHPIFDTVGATIIAYAFFRGLHDQYDDDEIAYFIGEVAPFEDVCQHYSSVSWNEGDGETGIELDEYENYIEYIYI